MLRWMTSDSTTAWDRLWPVLLAAGLAFAAALLVQLYVVPRVEQRKRREERWERDVRDLGEHVAFSLSETSTAYLNSLFTLWASKRMAGSTGGDGGADDVRAARVLDAEVTNEVREHREAFRNSVQRTHWLSDRVIAVNSRAPDMVQLWSLSKHVDPSTVEWIDPTARDNLGQLSDAQLNQAVELIRGDIKDLVAYVGQLAASAPPRPARRRARPTPPPPRGRRPKWQPPYYTPRAPGEFATDRGSKRPAWQRYSQPKSSRRVAWRRLRRRR